MLSLPTSVLNYLYTLILKDRSPAYLLVSKQGHLIDWGGELNIYGVSGLQRGEEIGQQVFFLEGLLPLDETPLFLPRMQTDYGRCADMHLFSGEEGDWVLFLDATLDEIQHSLLQQYRNDLSLLRECHAQILNQQSGHRFTERLPLLTLPPEGDRRETTILFAALQDFVSYSEQHPPQVVFKALNLYWHAIMQSIVSEAGIADKLPGNTIMACFGILPSTYSAPAHAIQAARNILEAVKNMNQIRQARDEAVFEVTIGIASGPISLCIVGNRDDWRLCAIGYYVNLAATLQRQAKPGEILINGNTFVNADAMKKYFSEIPHAIPELAEPIQIYSSQIYSSMTQ